MCVITFPNHRHWIHQMISLLMQSLHIWHRTGAISLSILKEEIGTCMRRRIFFFPDWSTHFIHPLKSSPGTLVHTEIKQFCCGKILPCQNCYILLICSHSNAVWSFMRTPGYVPASVRPVSLTKLQQVITIIAI